LHEVVEELKGVTSEVKIQINSVLNNLIETNNNIANKKTTSIAKGLLKLLRDYKL
jgi:hypothetical protein